MTGDKNTQGLTQDWVLGIALERYQRDIEDWPERGNCVINGREMTTLAYKREHLTVVMQARIARGELDAAQLATENAS